MTPERPPGTYSRVGSSGDGEAETEIGSVGRLRTNWCREGRLATGWCVVGGGAEVCVGVAEVEGAGRSKSSSCFLSASLCCFLRVGAEASTGLTMAFDGLRTWRMGDECSSRD